MPSPEHDRSSLSAQKQPRRKTSRRRRLLFIGVYLLFLAGLAWLGERLFWKTAFDVPLFDATQSRRTSEDNVWQLYYGELFRSGVLDDEIPNADSHLNVVLLGASVLEQVADVLEEQLRQRLGNRLHLFNLAVSAHTTRDSFHKYRKLVESGKRFEMLVVYHGINDVRMNCCPESSYRPDYTHCGWYDSFERRLSAGRISLTELVIDQRIPLGAPDAKHLAFGNTIKTIDAFRSNLEAILASAESENRPVLLPTFAYHIPARYTREKFRKGELDYGPGQNALPAEIWGLPHNVTRTIDAHNQVIRELARKHGCVILVDLARELPTNGRHFFDPCHLTDFGRQAFVERILPPLMRRLSVRVAPSPAAN